MDGYLKVGDQLRETRTRFRNIIAYEAFIINIDENYDSEDATFKGHIY